MNKQKKANNIILKRKNIGGLTYQFQNILYSSSNQDSMALLNRQINGAVEQNKGTRNRFTNTVN